MPKYLIQAAYSTQGLKGLQKDKASGRRAAVTVQMRRERSNDLGPSGDPLRGSSHWAVRLIKERGVTVRSVVAEKQPGRARQGGGFEGSSSGVSLAVESTSAPWLRSFRRAGHRPPQFPI
jgi:hypothetical protein